MGPGFFIIFIFNAGAGLWVADGSHKNVNDPLERKLKIAIFCA